MSDTPNPTLAFTNDYGGESGYGKTWLTVSRNADTQTCMTFGSMPDGKPCVSINLHTGHVELNAPADEAAQAFWAAVVLLANRYKSP